MDPFAQQILQYTIVPARMPDETGQTTIARATRYSKGTETRQVLAALMLTEGNSTSLSGGQKPVVTDADFSMQSAIMYGIVQPMGAITQQAHFTCPSGSCFYPPFASLSVCSACHDLTPSLQIVQVSDASRLNISLDTSNDAASATATSIVRYRLPPPSGLYLDNSVSLTMSGTANLSQSTSFSSDPRAEGGLIWAQTVLRHRSEPFLLGGDETGDVEVTECMLYYCVKNYTSFVVNGTLSEQSVDLNLTKTPDSWSLVPDRNSQRANLTARRSASLAFHPRFSYLRRTDLQLDGGYNISQAAVDGISSYFQRTFAACLTGITNCTTTLEPVAENWMPLNGFYMVSHYPSQGLNATQYKPSVAQALWAASDLSAVLDGVAASASNALRNGADSSSDHDDDANLVRGEIEVPVTRYAVDARWSLLHWVVEVGGIAFVAVTLYKSWRASDGYRPIPLWGSSTLAVLSRGGQVGDVFAGAETLEEMEDRARRVGVVLVDGRIVEVEGGRTGEVGLDEFMVVEGEGGKLIVREHGGGGGRVDGAGQRGVAFVGDFSD